MGDNRIGVVQSNEVVIVKPLLVGESNPYGGPPGNALIPDPPYCAGWNLCHKILQLTELEYYDRFDRVNLCHRDWKMKEARAKALALQEEHRDSYFKAVAAARAVSLPMKEDALTPTVLLGSKVCGAFGFDFAPFSCVNTSWNGSSFVPGGMFSFIILPHPSGLSRAWNEPGAFERARAVLREAGVL